LRSEQGNDPLSTLTVQARRLLRLLHFSSALLLLRSQALLHHQLTGAPLADRLRRSHSVRVLAPQLLQRAPGPLLDFSLVPPPPNPLQPLLHCFSSGRLLPLVLLLVQPLLLLSALRSHRRQAPAQLLFSLDRRVPQRQQHSLRLASEHRRAVAWTQVWTLALAPVLLEVSGLNRLEASARPHSHLASVLKRLAALLRLLLREDSARLLRAASEQAPPQRKGSGQLQLVDSVLPRAADSEQLRRQHLAPNLLHPLTLSVSRNLLQLHPVVSGQHPPLSERRRQPRPSGRLHQQEVDSGRPRLLVRELGRPQLLVRGLEQPRLLARELEHPQPSMQEQEQLRLSMQEQEQLQPAAGSTWVERHLGAIGQRSTGGHRGSESSDAMVGVLV
jgi:hypothetical protein